MAARKPIEKVECKFVFAAAWKAWNLRHDSKVLSHDKTKSKRIYFEFLGSPSFHHTWIIIHGAFVLLCERGKHNGNGWKTKVEAGACAVALCVLPTSLMRRHWFIYGSEIRRSCVCLCACGKLESGRWLCRFGTRENAEGKFHIIFSFSDAVARSSRSPG